MTPSDQDRADAIINLLTLEQVGPDSFSGFNPNSFMPRIYGGQTLGQGLVAAGHTVEDGRTVHSFHSHFIRPGDPSVPMVFDVERIRDGRSFSLRRVEASQHGKLSFTLTASFQVPAEGLEHMTPMPDAPAPERVSLALDRPIRSDEVGARIVTAWPDFPFEVRHVEPDATSLTDKAFANTTFQTWMRAVGTWPDDPILHAGAMAFASDLPTLTPVFVQHDIDANRPGLQAVSLDHTIWYHHPFRADEWLLYHQETPSASSGRGFSLGRVFTQDGRHVATTTQEGVIRIPA